MKRFLDEVEGMATTDSLQHSTEMKVRVNVRCDALSIRGSDSPLVDQSKPRTCRARVSRVEAKNAAVCVASTYAASSAALHLCREQGDKACRQLSYVFRKSSVTIGHLKARIAHDTGCRGDLVRLTSIENEVGAYNTAPSHKV